MKLTDYDYCDLKEAYLDAIKDEKEQCTRWVFKSESVDDVNRYQTLEPTPNEEVKAWFNELYWKMVFVPDELCLLVQSDLNSVESLHKAVKNDRQRKRRDSTGYIRLY